MTISPKLETLLNQASRRSKFWLVDAVADKRENDYDGISEAADDFARENGKGGANLANAILRELGEAEIFN